MAKRKGLEKATEKPKNYLFDILNDIKSHKKGDLLDNQEYENAFDKFMIMRWLSMNDEICEYINYVNDFHEILTKKQLYKLLIEIVPITKSYDPYIKSEKEELIEGTYQVAEYYECSLKEAKEYIKLMGYDWLTDIRAKFGVKAIF